MKELLKNGYLYLSLLILASPIIFTGGVLPIYLGVIVVSIIGVRLSKDNIDTKAIFSSLIIFSLFALIFVFGLIK